MRVPLSRSWGAPGCSLLLEGCTIQIVFDYVGVQGASWGLSTPAVSVRPYRIQGFNPLPGLGASPQVLWA